MHWTQRDIEYLRQHGHEGYRAVAAALGRDYGAVRAKAKALGICFRRMWSDREIAFLRANVNTMTARQIGEALNRPMQSVHTALIRYLGVRHRRVFLRPDIEAKVRRLHANGWTDAEIARELGCERHTVGDWRRRLGLACNALSEHRRQCVREKTREQLAKAGVATLGALRVKVFRDRARAAGWPADLRPRAVQMLSALWDRGPMTRRELAEAIGMPWKGSRTSLVSNDPEGSYLANLMARGLVVCLGRIRKGKGRGHSTCVYSLPLFIERNIPRQESDHAA